MYRNILFARLGWFGGQAQRTEKLCEGWPCSAWRHRRPEKQQRQEGHTGQRAGQQQRRKRAAPVQHNAERQWRGVGAGIGAMLKCPVLRNDQATRTETGFAVRIIVFSTATAMATSPVWSGRLRARSLGPIRCLYRAIAVSAWFLLPYPVAFCHPMRPRSAMSWMWQSRWLWAPPSSLFELGTADARGGTTTSGDGWRCRAAAAA